MDIDYSAPNLVVACLSFDREGGCFYHKYAKEPVVFGHDVDMILQMDHFFDRIGFPQPAEGGRDFKRAADPSVGSRLPLEMVADAEDLMRHSGRDMTLVIYVKLRQKATWQGECRWIEQNRAHAFSSVLGLLRIIDKIRTTVEDERI